jgi:uncharacterized membrane protein
MTIAPEHSGSRRYLRFFTGVIWVAVPAMAGLYAASWPELPARLATHFDLGNHPNGWMSREASLTFSLVMGIFIAALATVILFRVKKPDPAAWALLSLFYVILGTVLWAEESIITYNIDGRPVSVTPVLVTGISAAMLVVVIALRTRRGDPFSITDVVAVEQHGSKMLALVLSAATVAILAVDAASPVPGARVALGFVSLLMLASAGAAWSGFRYVFSSSGIEIRALGYRLRSIPSADIQDYAVERWNVLVGYGIRGVGNKRAYVWSNRGVRIKTIEGEVFLGHDQPDKILGDLDLITRKHEVRGAAVSS